MTHRSCRQANVLVLACGGATSDGTRRPNFTEQVETGNNDPERIGRTTLYYGNDSLVTAEGSDSSLEVYGTDGTQDAPRKWEGFGEYKLVYMLRNAGLDYLGNATVVRASSLTSVRILLRMAG